MDFFTYTTGLAALAVVVLQQLLKMAPVSFTNFANKYPVPTNIALSIGISIYIVQKQNTIHPVVWTQWVALVATISVVSAIVYNSTVRNWTQVRALESPKAQ